MAETLSEKFSELFTHILMDAEIEYACGAEGYAYVVHNEQGIVFSIKFDKLKSKYIFGQSPILKAEYKKHGIPTDAIPDHKMVYETVAFGYKLRKIAIKARKDILHIYKEILIDSDTKFQMRGTFETYMVFNNNFPGYAIGYDEKTGKYGFKRYLLVDTMYKICDISPDKKPDYAHLYKNTKDYYMAQVALENIEHLYD